MTRHQQQKTNTREIITTTEITSNEKHQDATPSTNKEKQNSLTNLSYAKVPVARIKTTPAMASLQ